MSKRFYFSLCCACFLIFSCKTEVVTETRQNEVKNDVVNFYFEGEKVAIADFSLDENGMFLGKDERKNSLVALARKNGIEPDFAALSEKNFQILGDAKNFSFFSRDEFPKLAIYFERGEPKNLSDKKFAQIVCAAFIEYFSAIPQPLCKNVSFSVEGSSDSTFRGENADWGEESQKFNDNLSQQRADYVSSILKRYFDIPSSPKIRKMGDDIKDRRASIQISSLKFIEKRAETESHFETETIEKTVLKIQWKLVLIALLAVLLIFLLVFAAKKLRQAIANRPAPAPKVEPEPAPVPEPEPAPVPEPEPVIEPEPDDEIVADCPQTRLSGEFSADAKKYKFYAKMIENPDAVPKSRHNPNNLTWKQMMQKYNLQTAIKVDRKCPIFPDEAVFCEKFLDRSEDDIAFYSTYKKKDLRDKIREDDFQKADRFLLRHLNENPRCVLTGERCKDKLKSYFLREISELNIADDRLANFNEEKEMILRHFESDDEWTLPEIKILRKYLGTWHHTLDGRLQLVPAAIHGSFGDHNGGITAFIRKIHK